MSDDLNQSNLARGLGLLPRYDGGSLLNLPASICATLGASLDGLSAPLDEAVLPAALLEGVRAVVLLVVDGLGRWQLDTAMANGQAPTLAQLADRAAAGDGAVSLATITSVFPSSTIPALTTLNTGLAPAAHGFVGWWLFLEEFGEVTEIARWGPAAGSGSYQDEALGGHDPLAFFGLETLHQRLARAGVRSAAVAPASFRQSGFSRMVFQGADYRGYHATSSIFWRVDHALAEHPTGRPCYVYSYWDTIDVLAHRHGPLAVEPGEEVAVLDFALGRWLARQQPRGDLLFLLTADHGHVPTPHAGQVWLNLQPELVELLRAHPAGERRLIYLYARPGRAEELRAYCAERLEPVAELVEPAEVLSPGWLGPGRLNPATPRRVGDVTLLARDGVQLICPLSEHHQLRPYLGNHGSLDPREMLVPLLAVRI